MVRLFLLSTLVFFVSGILLPQNKNFGDDFDKAVTRYQANDYDEALTLFNQVLNNPIYKDVFQSSTIFKAKILIEKKKYFESEKILREFLKTSANDKLNDEAYLALAKNLYEQSFYYPAFTELVKLISTTKSDFYLEKGKAYCESIAVYHLDAVQIKAFADTAVQSIKPFLLLLTGKLYTDQNRVKDAEKIFNQLFVEFPLSNEAKAAKNILIVSSDTNDNNVNIGVLLPLTKNKDDGNGISVSWEVLEGIKYAVDEHNKRAVNKIGLIVKNISDEKEIKSVSIELEKNKSVKVILGPLFSSDVKRVLAALKDSDIPIISPTATDDDLVSVSQNFYQANPGFYQRGKILAEYLISFEGKRKMAIINSIDGYSPIIASAFEEEFKKSGGQILFRDSFKNNTSISSTGLKKLGEFKNSLEGIFIPLSDKSEAAFMLSQLFQNEIDLPIYGNQDWMLAKGLETATSLSNKLVFTSDYFIDYNDVDYMNFSRDFNIKTNADVNRNILYGYDAAKYILNIIDNTIPERTKIRNKMESGTKIMGYHNDISFSSERINLNLNIVKYNNGIFELKDRYELK